jgi:hypothetical protein
LESEIPDWKSVANLPSQFDLANGSRVTAVGYGKSAYADDRSQLAIEMRFGETKIIDTDFYPDIKKWAKKNGAERRFSNEKLTPGAENDLLYVDQRFDSGICMGDSGGPLFLKTDSGWVIVGIASLVIDVSFTPEPGFTPNPLNDSCKSLGAHTNVYPYLDWIKN